MRRKIIAGNWKMNLTLDEGQKLTSEIVNMYKDEHIKDVIAVLNHTQKDDFAVVTSQPQSVGLHPWFLTKDNLELQRYEVDHFANGELCLRAFEKNTYDVCVLDVMMPGMDGFALAEAIRKVNHEIPIIFLSAKT